MIELTVSMRELQILLDALDTELDHATEEARYLSYDGGSEYAAADAWQGHVAALLDRLNAIHSEILSAGESS